jgi:hypothetical protein
MNNYFRSLLLILTIILIGGCANDARLGHYVASVRAEQVYNPNATAENLGEVPDGNGERMEGAYQTYTGKSDGELSGGGDSQFIDGFAN